MADERLDGSKPGHPKKLDLPELRWEYTRFDRNKKISLALMACMAMAGRFYDSKQRAGTRADQAILFGYRICSYKIGRAHV